MTAREFRNASLHRLRASASARSLAWTSRAAWFKAPVPPPRTQPEGAALVASVSGTDELAAPVSSVHGAETAFTRRRRTGVRASGVGPVTTLFPADGVGGAVGCLSCTPPVGGGGDTTMSGMGTSPPSLSMTGCSSPAPPVDATNSGRGGVEFRGATSSGSW